jgi:hypothetical protein
MTERACQGEPYRIVAILNRCRFQRIQALEDAIAYRTARVAAPCSNCVAAGPGSRCDDHDRDLELIAGYERAMRRANLDLGPVAKQARQPAHADGTWP